MGELRRTGRPNRKVKIDKNKNSDCDWPGYCMSADEVNKYINQIAFSSAEDFLANTKTRIILSAFRLGFIQLYGIR